jgi:hypothetical protein
MTLIHKVRVSLNHLPALFTCHLCDAANPLPGYYDRLTTRLRSPAPLRSLRRSPNLRCAAVRSAWYVGPDAISNAIGYAEFFSRSHDAVIRVYDQVGNVIN